MRASNAEIADLLERVGDLLEAQHADGYRVRAYKNAAQTCRTLERPLWEILEEGGLKALIALPTIGKSLATSIEEYLHTGRLGLLDRLEGQVSPEDLFTTLPGVGDELAHRIHDELGIETLEELEVAAHDGRLSQVHGIGDRRAHAIRDELAAVLARSVRRRARRVRAREQAEEHDHPTVAAILEVDEEYRTKSEAGSLRRIAPRRFNPTGEAWLPVLHATREGWHLTALFSNTARAHRLGTTHDWVVVIYEQDGHEGQYTVVTEHAGPRTGMRVVRGRLGLGLFPARVGVAHQTVAHSVADGLRAGGNIDLLVDVFEVGANGVGGDVVDLRDLGVGQTRAHASQDLELGPREGGVGFAGVVPALREVEQATRGRLRQRDLDGALLGHVAEDQRASDDVPRVVERLGGVHVEFRAGGLVDGHLAHDRAVFRQRLVPELGHLRIAKQLLERLADGAARVEPQDALRHAVRPRDLSASAHHHDSDAEAVERVDEFACNFVVEIAALLHAC
jgi:hypothetical protein